MDPAAHFQTILILVGAYAVGCVTAGYYVVRLWTGKDIRAIGSRSSGATNVARLLGWQGFLITLLLDAGKGAAVAAFARGGDLPPWMAWATIQAVVTGHVWPAQLRFRGGKGIAPYIGVVLVYDWRITLALIPIALLVLTITRNYKLAGLAAIVLVPLPLWFAHFPTPTVLGLGALAVPILFAHRDNIRQEIARIGLSNP